MSRQGLRWCWIGLGMVSLGAWMPAAHAAGWGEALFAEQGHDFGPVPRGSKVRHPFVLTNRRDEPVTIVDVRTSCGCTTGKAAAGTVAPGESAVIEAEMDTRNFVGRKVTTLIVTLATARGGQAEVRLGVSSTILSDIVLNPGTIDLGTVAKGQTPSATMTIDRLGGATWKAERMTSTTKALTATLVETARTASGVSYQLTVGLRPDAPAGPVRDEVRILTNDPETPSIPVPVTALVRGELTATPSVLALGEVASAGGTSGRFLIRGTRPFVITAIEGDGDGFRLAADPERKAIHIVTLTYTPEGIATRGDLRRTFRVQTDLPDEPPVELIATLRVAP